VNGVAADEPSAEAGVEITTEMLAAAEANTQFTFDLYRRLAADHDENLVLSGYSVMSAFLMLAEGAVGPAASEIGETLHLPETTWTGVERLPWRFGEFSAGCKSLETIMTPATPELSEESAAQLADLEDQHRRLIEEMRTRDMEGESPFELFDQEAELVAKINELRGQLPPYTLRFANAVWCDTSLPLRADYLSAVDRNWGALAFPSDFVSQPEQERVRINRWGSDQTNGLIPDVLPEDSVHRDTRLVLTNAVYFKGNWADPFVPERTTERPFFLASGEEVTAMMMREHERPCHYVELTPDGKVNEFERTANGMWQLPENPDGFKLLELPYGGDAISMIVLLPNRNDGLAAIEAALTHEAFSEWKSRMSLHEVNVFLPRFTTRSTMDLKLPMHDLGLNGIFHRGGLLGLSDHPDAERLFVDVVVQQAYISVNEEGTEAAAVSGIGIALAMAVIKPAYTFVADHPFLYFIQHRETGAILFIGRLTTP
jgi:serine protease inhibitor